MKRFIIMLRRYLITSLVFAALLATTSVGQDPARYGIELALQHYAALGQICQAIPIDLQEYEVHLEALEQIWSSLEPYLGVDCAECSSSYDVDRFCVLDALAQQIMRQNAACAVKGYTYCPPDWIAVQVPTSGVGNPARVVFRDGTAVMVLGGSLGGNEGLSILSALGEFEMRNLQGPFPTLTESWHELGYQSILDFLCYEVEIARMRSAIEPLCSRIHEEGLQTRIWELMKDDETDDLFNQQDGQAQVRAYERFMERVVAWVEADGLGEEYKVFASWMCEHILAMQAQPGIPDYCDLKPEFDGKGGYSIYISTELSTSFYHDLKAREDGRASCFACGCNRPLAGVVAVSAGARNSIAVTAAGDLMMWGELSQLADGTKNLLYARRIEGIPSDIEIENAWIDSIPQQANRFDVYATDQNGDVWNWSPSYCPREPCQTGDTFSYAELNHALYASGSVERFPGPPVEGMPPVIKISRELGLDGSGGVWQLRGEATPVGGLPFITDISSSITHSLAVDEEGHVWCWGDCRESSAFSGGQTSEPMIRPDLAGIRRVEAGRDYSLALSHEGIVYAWGSGNLGQIGDGLFEESDCPIPIEGLPTCVDISAGEWHALALTETGEVWAWGLNDHGQLGCGDNRNRATPVRVVSWP